MKYFENKEITIEVTNKCGAKCIMCPREKMINDLDVMSNYLFQKIVNEAFDLGVNLIDFCGYGDVFLDRELMAKIKYAKKIKADCKIYISTTGNALMEKYHEDVLEYVDILKFSIYGYTKEVYELVMGGIKFEKSVSNIESFLRLNNGHVYTVGNYIVMDENVHETQDWIDYWEPQLSEVYVWKPHNYVDGRNYRDLTGKNKETCNRPLKGPLNIAVDGTAHVCCFDYNKHLKVGDCKIESITSILGGEKLKYIQEKHRKNDFTGLICDNCDQTIHDESVLLYKSNPERVVGMSNSSLYKFKN